MTENKEIICWYCGEVIKPEDLCQTDNDGRPEDTHLHCAEEIGISWTTEDGFDNDIVEEIKQRSAYKGYESYEIIQGLRDGSIDIEEEEESEEDEDE